MVSLYTSKCKCGHKQSKHFIFAGKCDGDGEECDCKVFEKRNGRIKKLE